MTDHDPSDATGPAGPERSRLIVLAVLFEGGLAPLAASLGWLWGCSPLLAFAWSARDALLGVAATVPMLGLLALVVRWPVGPLGRIKRFFDEEVRPLLEGRPWTDLALVALAAGVGEEMLFRGVVQGALGHQLGAGLGLALASLIFGALHPITPAYALLVALLGAYLGGVWLLTGNLLTPIVAHGLYDFLALLVLLRPRSGPPS